MGKKFKCSICAYIHEGNTAPDRCPQCKAPGIKFYELKNESENPPITVRNKNTNNTNDGLNIIMGLGKLVAGVCIMALVVGLISWIAFGNSDSDTYYYNEGNGSSGSNINFKGYQSKYGGNPCNHKDYIGGLTCSEKHHCSGFVASKKNPTICANKKCGHPYSDHK